MSSFMTRCTTTLTQTHNWCHHLWLAAQQHYNTDTQLMITQLLHRHTTDDHSVAQHILPSSVRSTRARGRRASRIVDCSQSQHLSALGNVQAKHAISNQRRVDISISASQGEKWRHSQVEPSSLARYVRLQISRCTAAVGCRTMNKSVWWSAIAAMIGFTSRATRCKEPSSPHRSKTWCGSVGNARGKHIALLSDITIHIIYTNIFYSWYKLHLPTRWTGGWQMRNWMVDRWTIPEHGGSDAASVYIRSSKFNTV